MRSRLSIVKIYENTENKKQYKTSEWKIVLSISFSLNMTLSNKLIKPKNNKYLNMLWLILYIHNVVEVCFIGLRVSFSWHNNWLHHSCLSQCYNLKTLGLIDEQNLV